MRYATMMFPRSQSKDEQGIQIYCLSLMRGERYGTIFERYRGHTHGYTVDYVLHSTTYPFQRGRVILKETKNMNS